MLWQLYPSYLLITIISLIAVTWYASESLKHFFLEQTASDLKIRAGLFEKQVLEYLDPLDEKAVDLLRKEIGKSAAARITIDSERFLEIIGRHVDRLETIIEDLLSRSRIEQEAGREEVVLDESRIKDLIETAIQVCEAGAMAKKIKIELSCAEDLLAKIDPPLLEQAIVNLIDNAIKYSNDGSTFSIHLPKASV